ncbi:MAG: hypothetical protein EGQ87_04125, partial [Clostridiales bacterium]|nr:hypothetical protein [Clostridiales bacterium]
MNLIGEILKQALPAAVPILLAAIAVVSRMVFGFWESVPLISDTGIYQLLTAFVLPILCCIFARKGGKVCKT